MTTASIGLNRPSYLRPALSRVALKVEMAGPRSRVREPEITSSDTSMTLLAFRLLIRIVTSGAYTRVVTSHPLVPEAVLELGVVGASRLHVVVAVVDARVSGAGVEDGALQGRGPGHLLGGGIEVFGHPLVLRHLEVRDPGHPGAQVEVHRIAGSVEGDVHGVGQV